MCPPDKPNEDDSEESERTRSYLMELEADRASPLCQDFGRHLQALRMVLQEIELRIENVNASAIPTHVPGDGPDLDILIDWFEAEAEDLIARHRDRDHDAININPFLAAVTKGD